MRCGRAETGQWWCVWLAYITQNVWVGNVRVPQIIRLTGCLYGLWSDQWMEAPPDTPVQKANLINLYCQTTSLPDRSQFIQSMQRAAATAGMQWNTHAMLIARRVVVVVPLAFLQYARAFLCLCYRCCCCCCGKHAVTLKTCSATGEHERAMRVRTIYSLFRAVTFCVNSRTHASSSTDTLHVRRDTSSLIRHLTQQY